MIFPPESAISGVNKKHIRKQGLSQILSYSGDFEYSPPVSPSPLVERGKRKKRSWRPS
jgi:hypothetical protein